MDVEEEAQNLLKKQLKMAEEEMIKLQSVNNGRPDSIFQIANTIIGNKKSGVEATAVKDPLTGKIVVSHKEMKKVILQYCTSNLQDKHTEEGFEEEKGIREGPRCTKN